MDAKRFSIYLSQSLPASIYRTYFILTGLSRTIHTSTSNLCIHKCLIAHLAAGPGHVQSKWPLMLKEAAQGHEETWGEGAARERQEAKGGKGHRSDSRGQTPERVQEKHHKDWVTVVTSMCVSHQCRNTAHWNVTWTECPSHSSVISLFTEPADLYYSYDCFFYYVILSYDFNKVCLYKNSCVFNFEMSILSLNRTSK